MKKIAIIILILALAFTVRFIYISNNPSGISMHSDERDFDSLAIGLLQSKGYVNPDDGSPTSLRPPGYAVFLALIYKTFGHNFFIVRMIQALIDSFSVCLLYIMALKIFNRPTAIFTAIFASFYITFVACSRFIYAETLFTFMLIFMTFLVVSPERPGLGRSCALGFLSAILLLVKSSAFFIPFLIILALAIKMKRNGVSAKKTAISVFVFFLCLSSLLMPWTVRNYIVHKRFVLISTNSGINMYPAIRPVAGKIFGLEPRGEIKVKADAIPNEADRNSFFVHESLKAYKEDPARVVRLFVMRFLFFWNAIDWEIMGGEIVNYHFIFILPFALLGTMFALKNRKDILLILGICLYFVSLVVVFQGTPRYRMPIDGFIIMFGCYGIYEIVKEAEGKVAPISCIGLYFLATYVFYKYSAQTKILIRGLMEKIGLW